MKFAKDLLEPLTEGRSSDELTYVESEFVGEHRWSNEWRVVFQLRERFYAFNYQSNTGEGDYDYWNDVPEEVECVQVQPVMTMTYVEVPK